MSQSNVFDVVDELRSVHRFYCSESVDAFAALVNGYCLAKEISPEPLWTAAPSFVAALLPLAPPKASWSDQIVLSCRSPRSQIPVFFAALDQHRGAIFSRAWTIDCDASWRADFSADEERVNGAASALAAPEKLALVEGRHGCWHLFYLNASGERYFEATMRSEEKLRRWAATLLRLGSRVWQPAEPGSFNVPWRSQLL